MPDVSLTITATEISRDGGKVVVRFEGSDPPRSQQREINIGDCEDEDAVQERIASHLRTFAYRYASGLIPAPQPPPAPPAED